MPKNAYKISVLIAMFVAFITIGAFIRIPIPFIPFTLQFLFTTLSALVLGGRLGALAVLLYIFIGLVGLPVFATGGGVTYILKPTFGYLIGFAVASYVTGRIAEKRKSPTTRELLLAVFIGLLIVYIIGITFFWITSTFYLGNNIGFKKIFIYSFLLAVPGDIVLSFVAVRIAKKIIPHIQNLRGN